MKIKKITFGVVRIPFNISIGHNLKTRDSSASVVVQLESEAGYTGYGEGAPRSYVTGESATELQTQAADLLKGLIGLEISYIADIERIVNALQLEHNAFALSAALELALLDVLGQEQQHSVADFLGQEANYPVLYSAVLPFLPIDKAADWLDLVNAFGFNQLKIKVGHNSDESILALARERLGETMDIRLDANRSWTYEEAIHKIKTFEKYNISSIEEPLAESDIHRLSELSWASDIPIMLDESLYSMEHAQYYAETMDPGKLWFNLKVTKCGGLLATSRLFHFAAGKGIPCQLGCNVGETAILSAAGRLFAQTHPVQHLEGSYAAFFMQDDIGVQPFGFCRSGRAKPMQDPGLGIAIDRLKLKKYSSFETVIQ